VKAAQSSGVVLAECLRAWWGDGGVDVKAASLVTAEFMLHVLAVAKGMTKKR
jgi:hypothetical protein